MTADGEFIESWGSKGYGPLQFEGPHAIAVDSIGRMYIGDRTNNRLQVLSSTGELLAIWTHWGRPSGIRSLATLSMPSILNQEQLWGNTATIRAGTGYLRRPSRWHDN